MSEFFVYYAESNIVCVIIFLIMLVHNLRRVDRQEKQIKYDYTLVMFILYFVTDIFWAAVLDGALPKTTFSVVAINFLNYLFMAGIAYSWLQYAMAVEEAPRRNRPVNVFAVAFPFVVATLVLILTDLISPDSIIDKDLQLRPLYYVFQLTVPIIYIVAALVYTLRKAVRAKVREERKDHLLLGFFPLLVVFGGLFQVAVMPDTPIFCFASTILMIIFYIQSMENQISLDPLTGLNNRGQLLRYASQESSIRREGRKTYVYMVDVNDFKHINDVYGHAEGDSALIMIADSLKRAAGRLDMPVFIGRYGGDEFVAIVHPEAEDAGADGMAAGAVASAASGGGAGAGGASGFDPNEFRDSFREYLRKCCLKRETPYMVEVGVGCDELGPAPDTFQQCIVRADKKLYEDKNFKKR